jgi:uncharacterized RDD family membrane protein YckC
MSMPQGGESGRPWETGPGAEQPGAEQQWQAGPQQGTPPQGPPPQGGQGGGQGGQPYGGQPYGNQPPYGGQPYGGQQQPGGQQYGNQQYGTPPQGGGMYGSQNPGGPMQGRPISPVNEIETRVSGRRIVQYIVDAIIFGIVTTLISWGLNRGTGGAHVVLYLVLIALDIIWYGLYWAYYPYTHSGQTIGMQLMDLRVISTDGGPASLVQMFVRSILLVLFTPLSLLVGFITMMCSRYRQRVGDHMSNTMVVRASVEPIPAQREFAGAGQAGTR